MTTTFSEINDIAIGAVKTNNSNVSSWQVSKKKGMMRGISATVSGQGAVVRLQGDMDFSIISLESSAKYQQLLNEYKFGAGLTAFFAWVSANFSVETHRQEIHATLDELSTTQQINGKVHIDMNVTGIYPNVEVTAMAYVNILKVTNSIGNEFSLASAATPNIDTGAADHDGNSLPTSDNNSVIYL